MNSGNITLNAISDVMQCRWATLVEGTPDRFLTREGVQALFDRVVRMTSGGGDTSVYVESWWTGNLRWARNTIISAGDTTQHAIRITRRVRGAYARASTNLLDDAGLRACVREAERLLRFNDDDPDAVPLRSSERYDSANLWSDATANVEAAMRADIEHELVAPSRAAQLLSAGYLEVQAGGAGIITTGGLSAYAPRTRAAYSVTTRDPKGTGSGWAGMDHMDWRKIDVDKLSAIALDKCQQSIDPVAIEPGRYTVILEPQAVADLMYPLIQSLDRYLSERGRGPWADQDSHAVGMDLAIGSGTVEDIRTEGTGISKIGLKVLDERISISADPTDLDMPFLYFNAEGEPIRPTRWIGDGVLKALSYAREYAQIILNQEDPRHNSYAFRMAGGPTTIPEMIASTERGLLVTRLVNVRLIDGDSLLCGGQTADGLWLIERGKIRGPVKNFRFRESPLYAFNNLEALGAPTRVLMEHPTIVPPAKIRDFSMTSLADAV